MGIFSEELRQMDKNTVQYMIDEMQETIDKQQETMEVMRNTLSELKDTIVAKEARIRELEALTK